MKNLLKKNQDDLQLSLTILRSADSANLAHLLMGGSNGIWTCATPLRMDGCARKGTVAVLKLNSDQPGGSNFYICGKFGDPVDADPKNLDLGWPNPETGGNTRAYKIDRCFTAVVPEKEMIKFIKDDKGNPKEVNQYTKGCFIGAIAFSDLIKKYSIYLG